MYGETMALRAVKTMVYGLSPHVRGNLKLLNEHSSIAGSIPACTGKPKAITSIWQAKAVYPRMYGETTVNLVADGLRRGLSPHVRGNR